jgi:hypothetical protein
MEAADREVTGRLADPSAPEASWPYPGPERIFFVAECDIHEGSPRAWKLQPKPPEATGRLLHAPRDAQLPGTGTTQLDDLALVCPNCHRMLHRSRPPLTVEALRELIRR